MAAHPRSNKTEVRSVDVSTLRPWERNPRSITAARLKDLERALAADPEMLWVRPLIALTDGTVICGNQRLLAARALGWQTIPVATVDLEPEQAASWALRDNNEYGYWQEKDLADLLRELKRNGIELVLTGFDSSDFDRLLVDLQPERDPDETPPLPATPDSRPGCIYELGPHRLLCGDATNSEQLATLLNGELAEVLWTDPPYGVGYVGKTPAALRIENDSRAGLEQLLAQAFAAADAVLAPSARLYICGPGGMPGLVFRQQFLAAGWRLHQTLVWVKQSLVLGHSDYHQQHEDVLYGFKPGAGRAGRGRHAGSRWYGDNAQSTVFHVPRPTRSTDHPTTKPVALVEAMLRNSSRRGELVLDPFAGSGTTLIACERLGRRCVAVELDPAYCDVIRRRYREFVGDGS